MSIVFRPARTPTLNNPETWFWTPAQCMLRSQIRAFLASLPSHNVVRMFSENAVDDAEGRRTRAVIIGGWRLSPPSFDGSLGMHYLLVRLEYIGFYDVHNRWQHGASGQGYGYGAFRIFEDGSEQGALEVPRDAYGRLKRIPAVRRRPDIMESD